MQGRLQEAAGPAPLTETGSERTHPATSHGALPLLQLLPG